jgi:hypothetical protein
MAGEAIDADVNGSKILPRVERVTGGNYLFSTKQNFWLIGDEMSRRILTFAVLVLQSPGFSPATTPTTATS